MSYELDAAAEHPFKIQALRTAAWNGFTAGIYAIEGGVNHIPRFPNNNLCMLAGTPMTTRCISAGLSSTRAQMPGQMDIIPAGMGAVWTDCGASHFLVVNVDPLLIEGAADSVGLDYDALTRTPKLGIRDGRLEHLCWSLVSELQAPERSDRLFGESLGLALASQFVRLWGGSQNGAIKLAKRRMRPVLEYIEQHVGENLSLATLATLVNLSPSHFKVAFKETTGVPVHRYVMQARLRRARTLLSHTDLPITEVALRSGFANQSHLARALRSMGLEAPKTLRESKGEVVRLYSNVV